MSSPPCFIRLLSKSLDLIGLRGDIKGKFSKKCSKFFFSETVRRMKLKLGILENFYCLIGDNKILFPQKCLLNSSPHFIRLLSDFLNVISCQGNIDSKFSKKVCFSRTISRLTVAYMLMALATSLDVLFYCCATADILTKLLQQCFLFFIVVVIPGQ